MLAGHSLAALFGTLLAAVHATAADPEPTCPILDEDDFESCAKRWLPTDEVARTIKETDRGRIYSQFQKETRYSLPHSSPRHLSLLEGIRVEDFQLTVDVLSTHPDYDHRDACLVFGHQDPAHFCYFHLGKKSDDHANQIFIVNGADRVKISTQDDTTDWDNRCHRGTAHTELEPVDCGSRSDVQSFPWGGDDEKSAVVSGVLRNHTRLPGVRRARA